MSESRGETLRCLLLARGGALYGSQWQLLYLVGALDRWRFEPIVVADRAGPFTDTLRARGVEAHVLPMRPWRGFPRSVLRYADAWRIARLARARGARLVHASDIARCGYMHFVARRLGIPSLLHIRGRIPPRRITKHRIARATAVATIAARYRQDLIEAGLPAERIAVIDDAVDLERFRPHLAGGDHLRRRFGADGQVLVGLVGRIEPSKRVLEFLEAVAAVAPEARRRASFLIVGQPKNQDYCRLARDATRRLGIDDRVVFTGHCRDMPEVMSGLDVLATMSGGSVMFEAMACARCVLSVRPDGRHSEHTRHGQTAWCVTTDGPAPVGEALARLIEDEPLRQRIGLAARAWAEQHLSPAIMVAKTQALYERLAGP